MSPSTSSTRSSGQLLLTVERQGQVAKSDGRASQMNNSGYNKARDLHQRTRDGLNPYYNNNFARSRW